MNEGEFVTLQQWEVAVSMVKMHAAWPHRIKQIARLNERGAVDILTKLDAPCIDTGLPQTVHQLVQAPAVRTLWGALRFLAKEIKRAIEHEVDECLLVGGKPLRNPHVSVGSPCPDHEGCMICAVTNVEDQRYACTARAEMRVPR